MVYGSKIEPTGKGLSTKLCQSWQRIQIALTDQNELKYRFQKLVYKMDAVYDKVFLKTVHARQILESCLHLTEQIEARIAGNRETPFILLTDLEKRIDDLVRKTHAFRIKAG
jgi:hypothetical protein